MIIFYILIVLILIGLVLYLTHQNSDILSFVFGAIFMLLGLSLIARLKQESIIIKPKIEIKNGYK